MIDLERVCEIQAEWESVARVGGVEAENFARRSLEGCARSLDVVAANLARLGYPAVPGRVPPRDDVGALVERCEAALGGPVPPVLRLFWELVGGVALVDLDGYAHEGFWDASGLRGARGYCDGVFVDACTPDWIRMVLDDPEHPPTDPLVLSLSPDGYHKDDTSGGPAYGMPLERSWLAPWLYFAWSGHVRPRCAPADPPDLLGYLRASILECAGFPGLYGTPEFESFRHRVLTGVAPF